LITVSIVSHGHGEMVGNLVAKLITFSEIKKIIVTFNIPEKINIPNDSRVVLLKNISPRGFGANHNTAFRLCVDPFFCVLNPDILFISNPFSKLIESITSNNIGLAAPMVINSEGCIEDSVRYFPTLCSILLRIIFKRNRSYLFSQLDPIFSPEWVAGMCMFFRSTVFSNIEGFDERYFLYVEDVDICTRVWLSGFKVLVNPGIVVIHNARRASHKNFHHFFWHLKGMIRYLIKYFFVIPKVSEK